MDTTEEQGRAAPEELTLSRRAVVRGTLVAVGGLAATPLAAVAAPLAAGPSAAPGRVVTPDPIKPRIQKSGLKVALADFSTHRAPATPGPSPASTSSTTRATARAGSSPTTATACCG